MASDTDISVVSDRPDELAVPETVTISGGQSSVAFDLVVIDDDDLDGAQTVTVTARRDIHRRLAE